MAEPELRMPSNDEEDLPRTLRRARAEQARERSMAEGTRPDRASSGSDHRQSSPSDRHRSDADYAFDAPLEREVVVTGVDIPFVNLVGFFLKCAFAGLPALLVVIAILFAVLQLVGHVFPGLLPTERLIVFP